MKSTNLLKFYLGICAFYMLLILLKKENWAWYFKPLLVPVLFFATKESDEFPTKKWLLSALLFSWIGDIILLFSDKGELYFIFGLVAFLTAHILYITLFVKQETSLIHKEKNGYWFGYGLVLLYLFGMLSVLIPKLGDLKIPVGIYAMTISLMLIETLKGYFNWKNDSKKYILIGAIFFVISDSLLAFNKFYEAINNATLLIMTTYIAAQYFIVKGILELNKK